MKEITIRKDENENWVAKFPDSPDWVITPFFGDYPVKKVQEALGLRNPDYIVVISEERTLSPLGDGYLIPWTD